MTPRQLHPARTLISLAAICALLAAGAIAGPLAGPAHAATHSVATQSEFLSAIADINSVCDGADHHISITQDIAFTTNTEAAYTCDDNLVIEGTTFLPAQVDGTGSTDTRFLDAYDSSGDITFRHLSIDNFGGSGVSQGGAVRAFDAYLVFDGVQMHGNSAVNGGAVSAYGNTWVVFVDSTLSANEASTNGGAVYLFGAGMEALRSAFIENDADDDGGAIYKGWTGGAIYIEEGVYTGNTAQTGGAIFAGVEDVSLERSMITDNVASAGSGVHSATGDVTVASSTFTGNNSTTGGAIDAVGPGATVVTLHGTFIDNGHNHVSVPGASATLESFGSVFNGSTGDSCDATSHSSGGYNWAPDASCVGTPATGDVTTGTDPMLGDITLNGGNNGTMRPLAGSPLIDAIPPSTNVCEPHSWVHDQRSLPRLIGTGCDIGAVEVFDTFTDVSDASPAHPFMSEIATLVEWEVTDGYPDGTFRPTAPVSRQAMAAFLYRADSEPAFTPPASPTFTDVDTSHPFYLEIEWLVAQEIADGYPDGTFQPTNPVSRQAMAAFLYRAEGPTGYVPPATPTFPDVPTTHAFFLEIEWLADRGVTGGYTDGTFRPGSGVSRQAMAAFLTRLLFT